MEEAELKQAVETLLFITDQPIKLERLAAAVGVKDVEPVCAAVAELQREYDERGSGVQIIEIAEGWQMATRSDLAKHVRRLYAERMTMRLSTAALETLSIIAYKQPLTRAEVEMIRGVEVIAALETLLEKDLIQVVGRKESVGRPLLYGTTSEFLRHFGLRSTADLPPIDSYTPPPDANAVVPEGGALGRVEGEPASASTEGGAAPAAVEPASPSAEETPVPPEGSEQREPEADPT
ncbi:MAG: SMC-Scp complex subunit ScpB [Elusimicrobiota bacterium]|jgi:segregation and condensation protein B